MTILGRTDLAIESINAAKTDENVFIKRDEKRGEFTLNHIKITAKESEAFGKAEGEYITIDLPSLLFHGGFFDEAEKLLSEQITALLPKKHNLVLVAGLGNTDITPDALGPISAERVLATRHIDEELARQIHLTSLRSVAVITPNVLGKTGIEAAEIIECVANKIKPDAVIVIDALCAAEQTRLGNTLQLSTAGISPGSGVKNTRPQINSELLKCPVISLGMPTVVDISEDENTSPLVVTPKDIDLLIDRAATLIGNAINLTLQPDTDPELLKALV